MHVCIKYLDDWHLVLKRNLGRNLPLVHHILRWSGRYIARDDAIFRSSISDSVVTINREEAMHAWKMIHAEISPAPCSCRPCHHGTTRMRFNLAGYEESTAVCSLPPQAHRNTAEAIFEWHACRVPLDPSSGRIGSPRRATGEACWKSDVLG